MFKTYPTLSQLSKDIEGIQAHIYNTTKSKIDEPWAIEARSNFQSFRETMRGDQFLSGWFIKDLSSKLQSFYEDYKAGLRPVLFVQSPPQHGKSWSIVDFISWLAGNNNSLRMIFASYS